MARATVRQWMVDLRRTSRSLIRAGVTGVPLLRLPPQPNDEALLAAARVFLQDGAPLSDRFVQLGLDPNWQTLFKAAMDAFEAGLKERRAGRHAVSTTQASIRTLVAEGMEAVRTLDVIIANSQKSNPVLMSAWLRCRRIVNGRVKGGNEPAADTPPTVDAAHAVSDEMKKAS